MLRNILHLALRNLRRNKLHTFINLVGLAMAMSVGLIVLGIISDLTTFDRFHERKDSIYRIISDVRFGSRDVSERATCPLPAADALENQFSHLGKITRVNKLLGGTMVANGTELPFNGIYTDEQFFKVFTFPLIKGNPTTALSQPASLLLTETFARNLFGERDPLGATVTVNGLREFLVTGILQDPPKNSHINFRAVASFSSFKSHAKDQELGWNDFFNTYVYVALNKGVTIDQLNEALIVVAKNGNRHLRDASFTLETQQLLDIVPGPDLSSQMGPKMAYLPLVIMLVLVLLIATSAGINYTNLSLALSFRRSREVGLRKILGSTRRQLFGRFMTETLVIALLALVIAIALFVVIRDEVLSILPRASEMLTLELTLPLVLSFIGLAIFTGIAAGSVPAAILSGLPVVSCLKNIVARGSLKRVNFRKALIVFQFTLSLFLIIGVIVVYRQYRFSVDKDLGFQKANRVIVALKSTSYDRALNAFSSLPGVQSVSASRELIGTGASNTQWLKKTATDSLEIYCMTVDDQFVESMGLKLVAGKSFAGKPITDYILINEKFAETLGRAPSQLIGERITLGNKSCLIQGVIRDFHYMHLEEPIRPFFLRVDPAAARFLYLHLRNSGDEAWKSQLEGAWKKVNEVELLYTVVMDEHIANTYSFYTDFLKLFGFIAFLSISIGCLGLIGMALYAAESRTKEVGIRKIMGASEMSLLVLLSKEFVVLLLVACCFGLPAGFLAFNELLAIGTYRISIGVVELGSGALLLLVLGLLVTFSQTFGTTRANPAEVLRVE